MCFLQSLSLCHDLVVACCCSLSLSFSVTYCVQCVTVFPKLFAMFSSNANSISSLPCLSICGPSVCLLRNGVPRTKRQGAYGRSIYTLERGNFVTFVLCFSRMPSTSSRLLLIINTQKTVEYQKYFPKKIYENWQDRISDQFSFIIDKTRLYRVYVVVFPLHTWSLLPFVFSLFLICICICTINLVPVAF